MRRWLPGIILFYFFDRGFQEIVVYETFCFVFWRYYVTCHRMKTIYFNVDYISKKIM